MDIRTVDSEQNGERIVVAGIDVKPDMARSQLSHGR
jgi:hypothetical protein